MVYLIDLENGTYLYDDGTLADELCRRSYQFMGFEDDGLLKTKRNNDLNYCFLYVADDGTQIAEICKWGDLPHSNIDFVEQIFRIKDLVKI